MKYRRLGTGGPEVSEIGFGAWGIGKAMWVGVAEVVFTSDVALPETFFAEPGVAGLAGLTGATGFAAARLSG